MARTKSLSLLDLGFFLMETAERAANIGPLAVVKIPERFQTGAEFADWLMSKMKAQPVGEPFDYMYSPPGLRRMPKLEAVAVDLDDHCFRMTLPAPGNNHQLFDLICDIHVQRLDRSRPPWEFYIIDGLENRRIAIYAKVHHGLIDGRGFVEICTRWFSSDPKSHEVRAFWQGLRPRARGDSGQQASTLGALSLIRKMLGTSLTVAALSRFLFRQALKTVGMAKGTPLPFIGTPEVFVPSPAIKRSFAYCTLPFHEMKDFGKRHHATVNDILLTVLDMAMTRYVKEHGVKRHKPLVVDMPVALGATGSGGNKIAVVQFPLGTQKSPPAERLREICEHTSEVKDQIRSESAAAMAIYAAAIHGVPLVTETLGLKHPPTLANAMISNPFGFPERIYIGGGEVELALPISILVQGHTLNITAISHDADFQIAYLGIAKHLPDIQKLADYTADAFKYLHAAFDEVAPDTAVVAAATVADKRKPVSKATPKVAKPTVEAKTRKVAAKADVPPLPKPAKAATRVKAAAGAPATKRKAATKPIDKATTKEEDPIADADADADVARSDIVVIQAPESTRLPA